MNRALRYLGLRLAWLLTLIADIILTLSCYSAGHSWHLPAARVWQHELLRRQQSSDLVLLCAFRVLGFALIPFAFPATPWSKPSYSSPLEELRFLWRDTALLVRREGLGWLVWTTSGASLCYSLLILFKDIFSPSPDCHTPDCSGRSGPTASLPEWLAFCVSLAASCASLVFAQKFRRSARKRRIFAATRLESAEAGSMHRPLLDEEEEVEKVDERRSRTVRQTRLLARLIQLSRPDAWKLFGAFVCLVAAVACDVAIPAFKASALNAILHRTVGESHRLSPAFVRSLVGLAATSLGAGLFSGLRGGLLSLCNARLVMRLQQALFTRLIRMAFVDLDKHATGKLLSRLTTDTALVGDVLGLNVNVALRSLLRLLLTVAFLATKDVALTLVSLSSAITFFLVSFLFSRFQRVASKAAQEATAESNDVAEQGLSLARTVRAFCAEGWEEGRYDRVLRQRLHVQEKQALAYTLYTIAFGVLDNAQALFLLSVGGSLYASGAVSATVLTVFVFYSGVISASIQSVADMIADTFKALGASEEVFRMLDEAPRSSLDDGGPPCGDDTCLPGGPRACADLELQGVCFSYPARPGRVLDGVSFRLQPGQQVALVGTSGSGKSTIVQLLLRFYDPEAGRILFNGHDTAACSARWLRSMVAVVSQEPALFAVSIRDNVAYASADYSDAQVVAAADAACASGFICLLPAEYDTKVGPKGVQLSGGQKQRVALARAIIRQPPLLVLDEATSALDATSERDVQKALDSASKGRSVLVVAHRLSTVIHSDIIVVMKSGRVVESGTHESLLQARGAYHALVSRQLSTMPKSESEVFLADADDAPP